MMAGAEGLALLCGSEDFAANEVRERVCVDPLRCRKRLPDVAQIHPHVTQTELIGEHADSVVALSDALGPLLTDAADRRRVRSLMDVARRLKRRGAGK